MEIIREGPLASRPPVLDGKNYSYWKPLPKPEVDWTDAEEQASVENARTINAIFNGVDLNVFKLINSCTTAREAWKILEVAYEETSKVKISRLQLITSKFEALKMTEDESVSEYNERVLEIANDSLLLGEKIPESKIVRKVLRSLPRKFDMKETTVNQSDNEVNQDESIAHLTKQFSKMARKFKSMNNAQTTVKTERHDGEKSTRKAECPTYLKRQKKNYYVTLSDEDSNDIEVDHGMNAFTTCITEINLDDDSECSDIDEDEELTLEKLKMLRKEDLEARAIQKERIQDLMEENERLMGVISSLKVKLKEVQNEYDQTIKSLKMLNSGTDNLDSILNSGQNGSSKYGLGFDASMGSAKFTSEVRFVPTSVKAITEPTCTTAITNTLAKSSRWICYCCGRKGHINKRQEVLAEGHVTFGDGVKGRIIAKGSIGKSNIPCLNEVRYVDGLKASLIGISQLCDQGYSVNFNNTGYQIWLWHRKLGHISLRSLDKVIRNEAAVGIPSLDINGKFFCGDCQVGKQTKTSHRSLKECYTIKVLELLHLDLMGPMQIESLGGKKYVLVVVDDYSRFTWIRFLKGKSDTVKISIEPTSIEIALKDEYWINAMQEELLQFKHNNVWTFIPKPDGMNAMGTKIEAIRLLAGISSQPKEFVDSEFPQHVYKLNKALYGLKQAPRAWYERLTIYLGDKGYSRGGADKILFINRTSSELIVA
ncbi:gag-pol polyprotein [Cucumis melo var. makuwa]|uniref:Gag-pol polyprotein n=1 Tax=Cucumis melo var. makuwa TaxID=1194695 RepID=A0A5A7TIF9_CUCMM|nr:gag-pol polyprotein [Cucumis melo var. makuwa]TYK24315.1 gag-pol polyprotein [Cucumis melo var. makuwa]